jgi:proteic killer suppression protein
MIDTRQVILYYLIVIKSFRHRGLREYWETGSSRRLDARLLSRIERRLFALNQASRPEDMNVPGFDFHRLQGKPLRYTVHVNGPWCITFEWDETDAFRVDLEQYH